MTESEQEAADSSRNERGVNFKKSYKQEIFLKNKILILTF